MALKTDNVLQKYDTPLMEVNYFEAEDVILTSDNGDPDIGIPPVEPEL